MKTLLLTPLVLGSVISLVSANSHANLLTNGRFEMPDTPAETLCASGSFSVPGWGCFNGSLIVGPGATFGAPVSHDDGGSQSLKLFGFDGGADQFVPVTAGTTYEASVWAMNFSADPFNHLALLALNFLDADSNVLGEIFSAVGQIGGDDSFQQLATRDGAEVSDWTRLSVMGQAPAGTTTAKVLLLHVFDEANANPASAIYFDDASLTIAPVPDSDADGVTDSTDNCTLVANDDQRDTDGDGIGNACDPDLNNDCTVDLLDLASFRTVFLTGDANADLNGDGTVDLFDLARVRQLFLQPPGPSATGCTPGR
ncbi:MAG: hypothetical protein HKN06_00300 [Gammaproteobacteria bacterium]|nr:hypothetical protein [Gammaproteobacteria bacterium]